jgi:hypothetical protein
MKLRKIRAETYSKSHVVGRNCTANHFVGFIGYNTKKVGKMLIGFIWMPESVVCNDLR